MKRFLLILAVLVGVGVSAAQQTTITYWQYDYATRVDAMNQLIEQFEAANPDIDVVQETFPYDGYQQQVAASLPAGQGADVAQLFYGWLPTWERAGYVVPLPEQYFDAAQLDAEFAPMAQAAKVDGVWYGLPTAVRSLALFYNVDMLAEAGYDAPPATWDEFVEIAKALTVKQGQRFVQVGYGFAPTGQDHHLLREVLIRQFGGVPYSDDGTEVTYDSEEGVEALAFYTSWVTEHEFAVPEFVPGNNGYRDGFRQLENIAMIVDGSFAIGDVQKVEFNWGVTELPTLDNGLQSNFGSFFMNALTPNAASDPAKLEAAAKFLEFVTSDDAMRLWLDVVGELPARKSLIADPELAADPVFGPFVRALDYAHATIFVDETGQRDVMVDAINTVVLQGTSPADALRDAATAEQLLIDSNR